jgi:hypothetical protein
MPPTRSRPARSATTAERRAPGDERDAFEGAPDWDAPASPLAALVGQAVEAGVVDAHTLGERLGLDAAALARALDAPSLLGRSQRAELARALGVAGAVVRAACGAEPAREDDDAAGKVSVQPAAAAPLAAALPEPEAPPSPVAELPGARPRSLAELLERTVAAVADDALGRRVRLSLLTTVHTAAAEASRDVPPEVHGLRARVLRGELPWIGAGGVVVDEASAPADHELLDAVESAVRAAQRHGSGYDDLFAPLHDDALHALLRRLTTAVRPAALGATSECVVTPPLFGRHLALCSADASPDQRRVALRRALAHVLCGHVGEFTPLPLPAPPLVARTADVFALADLVPFWQVHEWRRKARLGWRATMHEASRIAAALAPDWDAARAEDAGRLRVLLYRERKL